MKPSPQPTSTASQTFIPHISNLEWGLKEKHAEVFSQSKACVKSAYADTDAPKQLQEKVRKAQWIKHKNVSKGIFQKSVSNGMACFSKRK